MEREELDIHIKELQAKAEAFFAQAGLKDIEVYRIEKFEPVRVEDQFIGKFYDGDSYVILKQLEKDYDIHYWHGKDSTMVKLECLITTIGRASHLCRIHSVAISQSEEAI